MLGKASGDFCDIVLHFVVILHLPALSSSPTSFYCLFFFIYSEGYGFELAFFTHRRFLPHAPSRHFWRHIPTFLEHSQHFGTICFYQGFNGSRQLLSWKLQGFIIILETQTRPYLFVWFTVIHNLCMSIHSKPQFMHVNIVKVFTYGENFDKKYRSAAKLISNHKNIKQQPN